MTSLKPQSDGDDKQSGISEKPQQDSRSQSGPWQPYPDFTKNNAPSKTQDDMKAAF